MYPTLMYLFHLISFVGPLLLTITTFLLWKKEMLLFYFVLGAVLNIALNFFLKDLFKEPRPSGNEQIIQLAINNGKRFGSQVYGMPSGHVQTAFYCTVFIFLSLKNWKIAVFYLTMALFTCYQKYIYKEHTLWQLFVGVLVGSVVATISFNASKKKTMGLLIPKPEDGAPY
jgi:membrane-associated phospholipid phosphatase